MEIKYFGQKERVKRGLLEVRFAWGGGELTVFGLHLKSRYTDRPDDPLSAIRRAAEATAVWGQWADYFIPMGLHPDFIAAGALVALLPRFLWQSLVAGIEKRAEAREVVALAGATLGALSEVQWPDAALARALAAELQRDHTNAALQDLKLVTGDGKIGRAHV